MTGRTGERGSATIAATGDDGKSQRRGKEDYKRQEETNMSREERREERGEVRSGGEVRRGENGRGEGKGEEREGEQRRGEERREVE